MGNLPFGESGVENPGLLSPHLLAYVGDAVLELSLRLWAVRRGLHHPREAHGFVVQRVTASAQREALERLAGHLHPPEEDVVRRGRNRGGDRPDRAYSTGYEALVGYLYLSGQGKRLWELLQVVYGQEGIAEGVP